MRAALFGASGKIGGPILRELVARGHTVTAVARHTSRIGDVGAAALVVAGDAFDPESVRQAADGADVIIVSVAMRDDAQRGRAERTPTELIRSTSRVAHELGLRFLTMGGAGSLEVAPGVQLVDTPEFPAVAKPESEGFPDALHYLRSEAPTDLQWTMLSPPVQIEPEGPRTGSYRIGGDSLLLGDDGSSRISAADLAVAMVDEAENKSHPRQRFTVAY